MWSQSPIAEYSAALARELAFDGPLACRVRQEVEDHLLEASLTEADEDLSIVPNASCRPVGANPCTTRLCVAVIVARATILSPLMSRSSTLNGSSFPHVSNTLGRLRNLLRCKDAEVSTSVLQLHPRTHHPISPEK